MKLILRGCLFCLFAIHFDVHAIALSGTGNCNVSASGGSGGSSNDCISVMSGPLPVDPAVVEFVPDVVQGYSARSTVALGDADANYSMRASYGNLGIETLTLSMRQPRIDHVHAKRPVTFREIRTGNDNG
jgi:hypothetical protein